MTLDRRRFLTLSASTIAAAALPRGFWTAAHAAQAVVGVGPYGPLADVADENGLRLPAGFTSRIVAVSGQPVGDTEHLWHIAPDGGAVFAHDDGGWIYVSNKEATSGGVGAIRFSADGDIVAAYPVTEATSRNCAGGATPWGTWLSCEEKADGLVYECDPLGLEEAIALPGMGAFNHEAAVVDPLTSIVYLTEDRADGLFYRYVPVAPGDLRTGALEAAQVAEDNTVTWLPAPASPSGELRHGIPGATTFARGEGAYFHDGVVDFTTTADNRVWRYNPAAQSISVLFDRALSPSAALQAPDNIVASTFGDLYVAEDGGNMELVVIAAPGADDPTADREVAPFLQFVGHSGSEVTGPAFDPSGTRLYLSSQRGTDGKGVTVEVTGPFRRARLSDSGANVGAIVGGAVAAIGTGAWALYRYRNFDKYEHGIDESGAMLPDSATSSPPDATDSGQTNP